MKGRKNITGIILAGGKSTRMGTDKGFVLYKNKAFVQLIIEALEPLVSQIIIVSNNPDYDVFGFKRIDDLIKDAGPIAGIYTGLYYSKTEYNLILSCDVPLINTETLTLLIDEIDRENEVIQFESNGKSMPLIALYKKGCDNILFSLLKKGEKRLRVALNHLKVKTIILDHKQEKYTSNINTFQNLKEIEI